MSILLRRSATASEVPVSLDTGELAVNTTDNALFLGTAGGVVTLLGAPVLAGTTDGSLLRWDDTDGRWEEVTGIEVDTSGRLGLGGVTLSATRPLEVLGESWFGLSATSGVVLTSHDYLGNGSIYFAKVSAETLAGVSSVLWLEGSAITAAPLAGNFVFDIPNGYYVKGYLSGDGLSNKDNSQIQVVTADTYAGLTPDANTVYIITT